MMKDEYKIVNFEVSCGSIFEILHSVLEIHDFLSSIRFAHRIFLQSFVRVQIIIVLKISQQDPSGLSGYNKGLSENMCVWMEAQNILRSGTAFARSMMKRSRLQRVFGQPRTKSTWQMCKNGR